MKRQVERVVGEALVNPSPEIMLKFVTRSGVTVDEVDVPKALKELEHRQYRALVLQSVLPRSLQTEDAAPFVVWIRRHGVLLRNLIRLSIASGDTPKLPASFPMSPSHHLYS